MRGNFVSYLRGLTSGATSRVQGRNEYSCMSLYMRWPLRNFYTFYHLVDSYRNTITEWAVGFRYGNFTLKLARGKKSLASRGLIFGGEEISIPETWPIQKSYIYVPCKSAGFLNVIFNFGSLYRSHICCHSYCG